MAGRLLRVALPLALADDLRMGISTVENLIVPRRLGLFPHSTEPLAEYGVVCGMVFPTLMFPASILYSLAELLVPEMSRCAAGERRKRIAYLTGRSLRVALLYGLAAGGVLFTAAECSLTIPWWGGSCGILPSWLPCSMWMPSPTPM